MSGSFFGGLMFACKFTVFSESRLWECRVLQSFRTAVYGNVVFLRCFLTGRCGSTAFLHGLLTTVYGNIVFSRSKKNAWHNRLVFFPGKGNGPGFSLC